MSNVGTMCDYQVEAATYRPGPPVNYYANSIFLGSMNGTDYSLPADSETNFYQLVPTATGSVPLDTTYTDLLLDYSQEQLQWNTRNNRQTSRHRRQSSYQQQFNYTGETVVRLSGIF